MIKNKVNKILAASAIICATSIATQVHAAEIENNTEVANIQSRAVTTVGTVINAPNGLNLRKSASTNSSVLKVLSNGTKVNVLSTSNGWHRVEHNGVYGYVYASYIKTSTSSSSDVTMSATGKVKTNDGVGVNLRKSTSTSSSIITVIPENATVTITAKNGSWYKVSYNGKTGYAHSNYITLNSSSNNNSSSNTGNGDVTTSGTGRVKTNSGVGLNLRQSASTSSSIVGVIPENATVTITAKNGSWYKVSYNGKTGYAHSDYIVMNSNSNNTNSGSNSNNTSNSGDVAFSSDGYVGNTNNEGLNLRKSPSTSASVITVIPQGATVTITAKNGTWYKVNYNGNTGYVASSYIVLGEKPSNTPSEDVQGTYEKVLAAMKAQIGNPYVWGGSGEYITDASIATLKSKFPNEAAKGWYDKIDRKFYNAGYRAFDCSGLMQWGFAQAGVSISRTTYTQVNDGYGVSKSEAQPGDLLITNSQGHVGMYIGNNQWIESPSVGNYIRIRTVNWNNIGYVRRVL